MDLAFCPALPPEKTRLYHQLPRLLPHQSIRCLSRVPRKAQRHEQLESKVMTGIKIALSEMGMGTTT
jgi:hypothetical protein